MHFRDTSDTLQIVPAVLAPSHLRKVAARKVSDGFEGSLVLGRPRSTLGCRMPHLGCTPSGRYSSSDALPASSFVTS